MGRISKIKQKEIMKYIHTYENHEEFETNVPQEYDSMNLCKSENHIDMFVNPVK